MRSLRDAGTPVKRPFGPPRRRPIGHEATLLIKRTFRGLVHLVGGLAAGFALVVMAIAWQFSQGPIPLGFLSPYIETAVNAGNRDITLRMGETILTWAGWDRALDIRVINVRLVNRAGTTIGSIPEVAFSISGKALVEGKFAPKSIDLFGPTLRLRRDRDGTIDIGFGTQGVSGDAIGLGDVDRLLDPAAQNEALSYLSRVAIIGGDVTVSDQLLGRSWHLPAADMRLNRYIDRLNGDMSLLLDAGDRQTALKVTGDYLTATRRLKLGVEFDQVSPAMFAAMASELAPLKGLDMPFSGRLDVELPIDGGVDQLQLTVTGGPGKLHLPKPLAQTLNVTAVALEAGYKGGVNGGEIKKFNVQLAPNSAVMLPAPISHAMPVKSFRMSGRFENGGATWAISKFDADLNGPKLSVTANLTGIGQSKSAVGIGMSARLESVPVADIDRIWPKTLGADAYTWVTTHISKGVVPKLEFKGRFRLLPSRELEVADLSGTMNVKNTVVDYLPPLPAVKVSSARMEFDESSYTIHIGKGRSGPISLSGGTVVITGLNQFDQFADIDLNIDGPVAGQLNYINHKPLQFAKALGIDPRRAGGNATTRLRLFFILEKTLGFDDVQVWARSRLTDVSMANVFLGRGINQGQLDLRVDKRGMDVGGTARFDNIPARFAWRENFADRRQFKSRYNLNARINDVKHIRDLGLDMEPFSGDYVQGAVDAEIEFTVLDDVDRLLRVSADITDASLSAPAFGWAKPKGAKGEATVTMNLAQDLVVDVPEFSVKAADLTITGAAKYAADGTGLERVDFKKIAYGRTDMAGALIPKADGTWEAGFHGESFDLSPMWADILAKSAQPSADQSRLLEHLTLAVELNKVWLDDKAYLRQVSGTFARDQEIWQTVLLRSQVSDQATFDLTIQPGGDGNRHLILRSDNAGEIFKFLDIYPNMVGGRLNITGIYDDAAPGQPLNGHISVTDYRVVNAPVLARLLSIMALSGILDALEGEGLAFRDLSVPFELNEGTFALKDARASGTALGFTATGKVFRHADVVNLEGTVIPAYALNSAFGKIPLLGDLLTGGEKGGGVFAATYTMTGPMEEPVVSVNPLSALAPGFLRNVFGIFGKANKQPSLLNEDNPPAPRLQ